MRALSIGVSAIRANQAALNTIANNIANAGTPGYHRQDVRFSPRADVFSQGLLIGGGVDAVSIARSFNAIAEDSLLQNRANQSSVNEQLVVLRQVESVLGPGNGSIHDKLNGFFADLRSLSSEPDNAAKRSIAVDRLSSLTSEINTASSRLTEIEKQVGNQVKADLTAVNQSFQELFTLNREIKIAQQNGLDPNNQLDVFFQKVNQLNSLVDVKVDPAKDGGFSFTLADGRLFVASDNLELRFEGDHKSGIKIFSNVGDTELTFTGGRVAGYQKLLNQDLKAVRDRLESFTNDFIYELDSIHSTGLPVTGEFEAVTGVRGASSTSLPLNQVVEFDQLQAGSLFVSVTDETTGNRRLEELSFDPETESIDDFVTKLNGIANLAASASPATGKVTISAAGGYRFDFAGRVSHAPDISGLTGTSVPQTDGLFNGTTNDQLTFTVSGTGTVGVTDGLSLQVTNLGGDVVGEYSIGSDYSPGSEIDLGNGIKLELPTGTVNDGESFQLTAVADADETGILTALGLNTLFQGTSASSIEVSDRILDDPLQLALGRNGNPGDGGNIQRITGLRDEKQAGLDQYTFEEYLERINLSIAQEVNQLTIEQTSYELIGNQLQQEIDSISGVDPNEQMVYLLQYQKAFEASVRVLSTVDQALTELFSLR